MSAVPVNCFEDGSPSTTLNSGGNGTAGLGTSSGVLFDTIVQNTGSSITYDTTHAHSGSQSCLVSTSSAVTCYGMWTSSGSLTQGTQLWFRAYFYRTTNPTSTHSVVELTVSGTRCADVTSNSTGTLSMRDANGNTIFTTTNTVPLNQWFRIEGYVVSNASAGQVELKLFSSADSSSPTETKTSAATVNTTGGSINQARFGIASGGVAGVSWWMDDVAMSVNGYIGPGPVLHHMIAGAPWQNGFTVISKAPCASSVRLKVATNSALSQNVQYVSAQTLDSYGYVRHQVTGLAAGTQYYFGLYDTPAGGSETAVTATVIAPLTGSCRTLPAEGVPQSFTLAIASCINTANGLSNPDAATTDWVNWQPSLAVFTGDFNYENPTSTSIPVQIATYENQILNYGGEQATMLAQAWGYYCRSNHDAFETAGQNTDSDNTATTINIQAATEVFPFGTLGDSRSPLVGLYQSWVCGRVRFIMVDIRNSDRSPSAATDNSSKTMLGTTQLQWFYGQLLMPEPMKVVISDTAWMGTLAGASGDLEDAKWWSYDTERQAIISFMQANSARVGGLVWMHGDTHGVGCATAAKNTWGGFPVYCAAPVRQTGAAAYNTSTFSQFYNNSGGDCRHYGRVTFTDNGSTITVNFQGWDAVNQVAQVSQTDTFSCPSQTSASGGAFAGMTA